MNLQLEKNISFLIYEHYAFCGYEITTDQIVKIAESVVRSWTAITEDDFKKFLADAKAGKLGMIYKSPISFMTAFNTYKKLNIQMMP